MEKAIILSAGRGSRLLPLTADRPKCLIEVGGKAILDHQLDAFAIVRRRVVVGGYRFDRLAEHIAARGDDVELRPNPFWAVSSSIGSVWAARDLLDGDFVIANGDTVYAPALVHAGLAALKPGVSLFVAPIVCPQVDDMLAVVTDGVVRGVSKTLDPAVARYRSLGIVAARDDDGRYRAALDTVIAGPDGINAFHHDIVDRLARDGGVHAVVIDKGAWAEIDRPEDIENWTG